MFSFKNVGKLVIPSDKSHVIEWRICNFSSVTAYTLNFTVESPQFLFKSQSLKIVLIVNGPQGCAFAQVVRADDVSYVTNFVHKKSVRRNNGTLWNTIDFEASEALRPWGISDLRTIASESSLGILIIQVEFSNSHDNVDSELPLQSIPVDNLKSSSPPCKECGHISKNGPDILNKNLKELYVNEVLCDFTINVGERKFKAHKAILAAQSKVFAAMLKHDLAEKETNEVNINDCDPNAFHEFLLYVYSGQVETFSDGSVIALYAIADKYGVQDLKEECVNYMKSNLSVDMFCSFIELASSHGEAELLKLSKEFFTSNAKKIISSTNWQTFLVENATLANELFLLMVPES